MISRRAALLVLCLAAAPAFAQDSPSFSKVDEPPKAPSPVGPGWTVIPLPAYTYNPNEGSWIGGLTPIFRANDQGEVEDIFAPLYLYNSLIGNTFTFNYFGYRDRTKTYHLVVSHADRIERTVDASYKDIAAKGNRLIVEIDANDGKSAFNRFYGFGEQSTHGGQSTYSMGDSNLKFSGGIKFSDALALIGTERYRQVGVENGASQTLPQTLAAFPNIPGIDGADIVGQSLTLQYDTRDNELTPIRGTYGRAFVEYDENIKFTNRNRWWRLTGEARHFYPHDDDRMVFVVHAVLDGVVGQNSTSFNNSLLVNRGVPFYERPTLGGETTLRGFGEGRFVDDSAWLINLEERIQMVKRTIMGNPIELELAPFLDMGRVSQSLADDDLVRYAQINPGVGVRMLARPNVAARMDIGWGKDGASVFVGLDYPF